ncbi:hypothetical protein K438DRAFT_1864834 [Mycena galopus ATCC 62051]|nr:hypothetical protein K438DRAFT_1864834 [Mycena galopus ATCC 62051]
MLSTLAADRAWVADLDTEILLLERSLFALRSQKDQAQQRLDSYKYPVLTLPNEIISEIFVHFLPIFPQYPPLAGLDSPTLLGQHLHLCSLWLTRSRSYPLALRLNHTRPGGLNISQILEAVIPHRARWERLEFNLSPSHIPAIEGPMPLLRHLDLILDEDAETSVSFDEAPLLRSVKLKVLTPLTVTLPLAQLTSLTLDLVYRHEYLAILKQAPGLVHCELGIVAVSEEYQNDDQLPKHAIELPCLESLALFMNDTPTENLDDFVVPALRSLRLIESFLGPEPINRLSAFIAKSGCKHLQEVCVIGESVSEASYHEAFPSIHRFVFEEDFDVERISYRFFDDPIFE